MPGSKKKTKQISNQQHVTIVPVDSVKGEHVDGVAFSSRSRISGESGHVIANVQSPHAKEHRIVFDRDHNVFEFRLLE
uniref:Uncharacterized protein n=1 Tax=Caenorhabditis japonica TaxID=281687 RepID=A0A8R1DKQ4_CAEJA